MFSEELLRKYNMATLEEYKEIFGDDVEVKIDYYRTFLIQTDHIPNKIIEAQVLGLEVDDYKEILECRQYARDEINRLRTE